MTEKKEKKKIISHYRIRGTGDRGAWYEVGVYHGLSEEDAIENCRRKNAPWLLAGLRLEAWEIDKT